MDKYEKTNKNKMKNCLNLIFSLIVLSVLTLGCLGPSASDYQCKGIVKLDGKTYEGAGKTTEKAELHSCNNYCKETDSELDAMYQIWLTGAKAKGLGKLHGEKPSKQDAIMEDENMLKYLTETCAVRCVKEANKGKHTLETSCPK